MGNALTNFEMAPFPSKRRRKDKLKDTRRRGVRGLIGRGLSPGEPGAIRR